MTKDEGLIRLTEIVRDDERHQDYERVTKLAETYYKMVTGDGISDLLKQVVKRESDEDFAQRKELTNSIIPPTLASTKLPFYKALRKKPLVRKIEWNGKVDENRKTELEKSISTYWGDASLEKYLEYAFIDYNYIDPNAFLITEFDDFDYRSEKAKPYPFVATSAQCIMYEMDNNMLQYLVVRLPIKYADATGEKDGYKFTIYLGRDTIVFKQVADKQAGSEVIEIGTDFYEVFYFMPGGEEIPARRFGYRRDALTQGRTFVSPFHDVIPYLNKTLKLDSELDLSTAMVAFPQRFAYVPPCPACSKGTTPDGNICTECHGTGRSKAHNSVMDVIELDMPRNPEDLIDLEKLLTYKGPPIDLLQFQTDYIEKLRGNIFLMMFNKELLTKTEVTATATEKILETDNMNDTLMPFAQAVSTMWETAVRDIATFTDLAKGIEMTHQYPKDFKFKTLTELMAELKAAKDADASTSTIAAIEDDINELLYADRPHELKVIRIKNNFNPFRGYSEENVRLLISQGLTTEYNSVLWANLESIFNDLEKENDQLYDLNPARLAEMVKAKAEEYIQKMKDEKPEPPQMDLGEPGEEPTEPEE